MFSWLKKTLKRLFSRKNEQEINALKKQVADLISQHEQDQRPSTFFSTHNIPRLRWATTHAFQEFAIPVTPDNFKLRQGTAMDDVTSGLNTAKDAFILGTQRLPQNLFAWFVSHGFIGHQACALIAQQWLVDKACTMKGQDAVRNGFQITINDGSEIDAEIIQNIEKRNKHYKLKNHLKQADKFNNVFGIRHILFVVESNDPDYYEKPFNPDGIRPGAYKGMSQIEPYWITPLLDGNAVSRPDNLYFYEPTFWQVSGRKIHRSHFVILRGPEVSDILKPSYIYGGLPLTQRIMERVYAAERTANEAPELAMTKRLTVRKLDLAKALSNEDDFTQALNFQAEVRNNYGFLAAGLEEDVTQLETTLTDLDVTIMTQYQIVSAVANIPATKLLGTSPKGFNATGNHEIETYHEELESIQENNLTTIVERHNICMMRSDIIPQYNIGPVDLDIQWNPINVPTAKEQAEVNQLKSQTDLQLVNSGAIDAYEVRDRIIADKESGYNGIESLDRPDDELLPPEVGPISDPEQTEQPDDEVNDIVDLEPDSAAQVAAQQEAEKAEDSALTHGQEKDGWYVYAQDGSKLAGPYSNSKKARNRIRKVILS